MAATASHEHSQRQNLPPSPPLSPVSTRRRHKKKLDPFEKLALTPIPSPPSSPTNGPIDHESVLTKIILTPVLFISFILSLFFVNYRNRASRTNAHSSPSLIAYLYPSAWIDPEPYRDPGDSTWGRGGSNGQVEQHAISGQKKGEQREGGKKKSRSWHLNKKISKVAKMEIGDAFQMRGRIILGMVVIIIFSSAALWMGMRWLLVSLSNLVYGSKTRS